MNTKRLKKRLCDPIRKFHGEGDCVMTDHGPLIYRDTGAKVLAVAHLDSVMEKLPKFGNKRVKCPQLDDRLGAWVILDVLPRFGIKTDILLTDSEEVGLSTASELNDCFGVAEGRYNWMFEFDRSGTDVVMYRFRSDENVKRLEDLDFEVGTGAFTDICDIDIGVSGFNFGVGYYNQHSHKCYADLRDTEMMVKKFLEFHNKYKNTYMEHTKDDYDSGYFGLYNRHSYKNYCRGVDKDNWGIGYGGYAKQFDEFAGMTLAEARVKAEEHGYGDDISRFVTDWETYREDETQNLSHQDDICKVEDGWVKRGNSWVYDPEYAALHYTEGIAVIEDESQQNLFLEDDGDEDIEVWSPLDF